MNAADEQAQRIRDQLNDTSKRILAGTVDKAWPTKHEAAMTRRLPNLRTHPGYSVMAAIADLIDAGLIEDPSWFEVKRAIWWRNRDAAEVTELGQQVRELVIAELREQRFQENEERWANFKEEFRAWVEEMTGDDEGEVKP